ncbi:hypothetical protein APE01nite_12720 [Acetobacter peroxydans]|uniref:Uncharacterized protein n=1 Tax=Acetobacter peroxydans TaxID=104098 RepID=A0A4Y3TXJ3_9PROT|nr:hypothetical protein AA13755_1793 [Acetobacter peroxydans NBRC 13755]GBR39035.1 hypothetical protein AA0475_0022 [Acetobacter peroxydans]GEB85475.1 hypothetical protein APE01nite_12720 [Acetobacter peroxydans]
MGTMQPDRKEEGHALTERALKGPDTGLAMAACRVTPLLIPETRRAVQHWRGTNAAGSGGAGQREPVGPASRYDAIC